MEAREGDTLTIGGPRGSLVVPEEYACQVYVCDEVGMPALRRRLESAAVCLRTCGNRAGEHSGCRISRLSRPVTDYYCGICCWRR